MNTPVPKTSGSFQAGDDLDTAVSEGITRTYDAAYNKYLRTTGQWVGDATSIQDPEHRRFVAHFLEQAAKDYGAQLFLAAGERALAIRSVARQYDERLERINFGSSEAESGSVLSSKLFRS